MKPTNQPPTRGKWFTAGILTMIADITGTLAQFMPMKAVFILAADDIPSFFPGILVDAGPLLTGLALVLAAAALAIISKFAKDLALTRSGADEPYPSPTPSAVTNPATTDTAPLTVKEFSAIVLIVVLFAGSAVVSLTFALTITAWIAGSAIVLAIKIHQGSRKPPFPNGRVEFVSGFKKWMVDSALWAAVGAAIFTLVVDFPALGLTGILLGAVLLRRVQQVVPDVVPLLMTRLAPQDDSPAPHSTTPTQAPYDFLATKVGNKLLTRSLHDLGLDSKSWRVVGRPDNVQITLHSRHLTTGEGVLLRLFAIGQERSLDHEYALRTNLSDPKPFHHTNATKVTIAGLQAIMLTYSTNATPDPATPVDAKAAMKWQISWEILCVESESLQEDLSGYVVPDPKDFLLPHLTTAREIKGDHQQQVAQLIDHFTPLQGRYTNGPRVIHFGGAVSEVNMIRFDNGAVEPVSVRAWGVGILGDQWGNSTNYRIFFPEVAGENTTEAPMRDVNLRFHVRCLARALASRNLPWAESQAKQLLLILLEGSNA